MDDQPIYTEEAAEHSRRTSRVMLVVVGAGLTLVVLLWAVWGFRWPPTAEVVTAETPNEELSAREALERQEERLAELEEAEQENSTGARAP